jgi:SpoVK/Ycf46/Vps4 family AAA+-type ATPase
LAQIWLAGALQAVTDSRYDRGQGGATAVRGTHLLVSGAPGLGKTEWVRALLSECDVSTADQAMELVVLDEDGTALSGEDRLSHLRLSLSMLRNRIGGVIVFDEADDVFQGSSEPGDAGSDRAAVSMANHRASLNRLIEDSRIPVIWIMNHPEILDPAVLRRFDTVIAFEGIPASVRLAMLQQRLGPVIDDAELRRWAAIAQLTPALIDRLAVVHERARLGGVPMEVSDCRHWLCSRLPCKHSSALKRLPASAQWDADAVQASEDLLALAQGIGRCGSARMLLYGEPGTGKTAYAHALAQLLDKPLLEKRASDLLSPWVGETEQRISQAFEAALQDDAVLFIDEVDSLLASRSQAVRNWEVSQVNELLEQLSDFAGVVVLATNRLEALDDAVLRRMDAKIRFDVLGPEQLRDSFVSLCRQMAVEPDEHDMATVARMRGLTPGDFACVQRRLAFAPLPSGDNPGHALVVLLLAESRLKRRDSQPIGFVPPKGLDTALDELARWL